MLKRGKILVTWLIYKFWFLYFLYLTVHFGPENCQLCGDQQLLKRRNASKSSQLINAFFYLCRNHELNSLELCLLDSTPEEAALYLDQIIASVRPEGKYSHRVSDDVFCHYRNRICLIEFIFLSPWCVFKGWERCWDLRGEVTYWFPGRQHPFVTYCDKSTYLLFHFSWDYREGLIFHFHDVRNLSHVC